MHQNIYSQALECTLIVRIICQQQGSRGFKGDGALLPSVGGCVSLQHIPGESHTHLPRTDQICQWPVAFHILPTTLAYFQ